MSIDAYTDYPFAELGDKACESAPIRLCKVLTYDGNKYCDIEVDGTRQSVKAGYLYQAPGRCGDVPAISLDALSAMISAALGEKPE